MVTIVLRSAARSLARLCLSKASVLFQLILIIGFSITTRVSAGYAQETWGRLFHGPWGEWYTGTSTNDLIALNDGGVLVVGSSNNRGVIARLKANGELNFSQLFATKDAFKALDFTAATQLRDGGFAVVGHAFIRDEDGYDLLVVRLDSSGAIVWQKLFSRRAQSSSYSGVYEYGGVITEDADGSLRVTGEIVFSGVQGCPYSGYRAVQAIRLSSSGVKLSDHLFGGDNTGPTSSYRGYPTSDGGYLVVLVTPLQQHYTLNVQKYSAGGALQWSKGYSEQVGAKLLGLGLPSAYETSGGYVIAARGNGVQGGAARPTLHAFKITKNGETVLWEREVELCPTWCSENPGQIEESADGGSLVVMKSGYTTSDSTLVKLDSLGGFSFANKFAEAPDVGGPPITLVRSLGSGFITATSGTYDLVVALLNPSGALNDYCKSLPITQNVGKVVTGQPITVFGGADRSGCLAAIGAPSSADVDLNEGTQYREVNQCLPKVEVGPSDSAARDFGSRLIGSEGSPRSFNFSNYNGLSPVSISSVSLNNSSDFIVTRDTCSGATLWPVNTPNNPQTDCQIEVRFAPKQPGARQASLNLVSDSANVPTLDLSGLGLVPPTPTPTATPKPTITPPATPTPTAPPVPTVDITTLSLVAADTISSIKSNIKVAKKPLPVPPPRGASKKIVTKYKSSRAKVLTARKSLLAALNQALVWVEANQAVIASQFPKLTPKMIKGVTSKARKALNKRVTPREAEKLWKQISRDLSAVLR